MSALGLRQQRLGGGAGPLAAAVPWFLLVLFVLAITGGMRADWFRWRVTTQWNPAFLEGLSWTHGQLSLPHPPRPEDRLWDTAYVADTDKVYNVFPPLQSIIASAALLPHRWQGEGPTFPVLEIVPLVLFGLPLPLVGFAVFHRRTGSGFWAAVLTLGWLGGTAVVPCLHEARNGGVHHINHLLSQVGLLLLAGELLGRRRLWVALVGLMIATWSRPMTALYGLALLAVLWREGLTARPTPPGHTRSCGTGVSPVSSRPTRPWHTWTARWAWQSGHAKRMAAAILGLAMIAALPMGLNWAKFGNPFRSGYELIYVGRDHQLALDARTHGLFAPHFVTRNAYYMNLALPWSWSDRAGPRWTPSAYGTSLWLTTPLAGLLLLGVRCWWRDPPSRAIMLCSGMVIVGLLLYHGTGQRQFGYYRFALDFLPVWFVVGARWLTGGRRRYATLICAAWSLGYFAMLGAGPGGG